MAKEQTLFVADDGTSFPTLEAAEYYETNKARQAKLAGYGTAAGLTKAETSFLGKHLGAFELFESAGVMPAVVVRKKRAPKVSAA